jgi:hypothetical protein
MEHRDVLAFVHSLRFKVLPSDEGPWYPPQRAFEYIETVWNRMALQQGQGSEMFVHSTDDITGIEPPMFALTIDSLFGDGEDGNWDLHASLAGVFLLQDGRFALVWMHTFTRFRDESSQYAAVFTGKDLCGVVNLAYRVLAKPVWTTETRLFALADLDWDSMPDSILVDMKADCRVVDWCVYFENGAVLRVAREIRLQGSQSEALHLNRLDRVAAILSRRITSSPSRPTPMKEAINLKNDAASSDVVSECADVAEDEPNEEKQVDGEAAFSDQELQEALQESKAQAVEDYQKGTAPQRAP